MHQLLRFSAIAGLCLIMQASAPACCSIVRLEAARTLVTAREASTGFTFRFQLKDKRRFAALKIGDPVWADFATMTVKLRETDAAPCCAIIRTPEPEKP